MAQRAGQVRHVVQFVHAASQGRTAGWPNCPEHPGMLSATPLVPWRIVRAIYREGLLIAARPIGIGHAAGTWRAGVPNDTEFLYR